MKNEALDLVGECREDFGEVERAIEIARYEMNQNPLSSWGTFKPEAYWNAFDEKWPTLSAFRSAGYRDLALFSKFFFSHWIHGDVPDFHREYYDIYNYGYGEEKQNTVYPRGTGKTAILKITNLHGIAYFDFEGWTRRIQKRMTGHPYSIIASASSSHSVDILSAIKFELEWNDLFNAAFADWQVGNMRRPDKTNTWNQDEIVCSNWAKVRAVGRETRIRGKNHLFFRPTLFQGDDLEGNRDTTTPEIIQKTRTWLYTEVIPSMYRSKDYMGRILTYGTVVHEHCLVNHIRNKDKSFHSTIKRIINENPETGDEESLWPEERPLPVVLREWEEAKENGMENAWLQENMNIPLSKMERVFDQDKIKTWKGNYGFNDDHKVSFLNVEWISRKEGEEEKRDVREDIDQVIPINTFIGVDPASRETNKNDFTVIMAVGIDYHNNVFILEYTRARIGIPTVVVNKILDMAKRYRVRSVTIETVGYQHTLYNLVNEQKKLGNHSFKLWPEDHREQKKKEERLAMMEPLFTAGCMHLREVGMNNLITELKEFPQSEHDDCLDGLWLALRHKKRCLMKQLPYFDYDRIVNNQNVRRVSAIAAA